MGTITAEHQQEAIQKGQLVEMNWDPITRIVGSLGIFTKIDFGKRKVAECHSTSSIFRGYSIFMKGKDPRDAHFITSRICGICGDNHATCATYAQNMAFGVKPPPIAEWIVNLGEAAEYMFDHNIFQDNLVVRRLGTLVGELDQSPGGGSKVAARELVQLLMDVHRSGLERIMELVFQSGREPAGTTVDKLGQDPIVRNLLLLYSLHPDNLETRVLQALDALRGRLRKLDSRVELVHLQEGDAQLRVHTSGHARGSMVKELRSIVEGGIYDLAPDVTSLTILGLEEEAGFVPLESLLKHAPAAKEAQDACC